MVGASERADIHPTDSLLTKPLTPKSTYIRNICKLAIRVNIGNLGNLCRIQNYRFI